MQAITEALQVYLEDQGQHYQDPGKLEGAAAHTMTQLKARGQEARQAFSQLVSAWQAQHPDWAWGRVSAWLSQAQMTRPHFWVYAFPPGQMPGWPSLALRLVSDQGVMTLCLELSIIERQRQADSLIQQARLLEIEAPPGAYYWVQATDRERRTWRSAADQRRALSADLAAGRVRKVLLRQDMAPLGTYATRTALIDDIETAVQAFWPHYQRTQEKRSNP